MKASETEREREREREGGEKTTEDGGDRDIEEGREGEKVMAAAEVALPLVLVLILVPTRFCGTSHTGTSPRTRIWSCGAKLLVTRENTEG